jgi:hypothetical protein
MKKGSSYLGVFLSSRHRMLEVVVIEFLDAICSLLRVLGEC